MSKFSYEEGEIKIARCQCYLCKYRIEAEKTCCQKYEKIPDEILQNKVFCPFFQSKTLKEL